MLDLRKVFNHSPIPMAIVHKETFIITGVNDAFCALFGYTPEEVLGLNILDDLSHEEDINESIKWANSGEESYTIIKRFIKKDGNTFWCRVHVVKDDDDLFGMYEDISDHRELERLYGMLSIDFDTFTYSASHDLLEPIRTVRNYVELIHKLYSGFEETEEAKEAYKIVISNLGLVKRLIDALLSYSRIGIRKTEIKTIKLSEAIEQCKYSLQSLINETGAQIISECDEVLNIDELHIQRLFQNLIQNALKYAEHPIIKIGCEKEGKGVKIWVKDNGPGIDKRYHKVIFKLFKRISTKENGVGIGLSECKRIVELHKGAIWVESELGKGSTFFFTLY